MAGIERPSEYFADMTIHLAGIVLAVTASLWLLTHVGGGAVVASVAVYCAGLLAMIGASAAYNLVPHRFAAKQILRRLDHAAIFVMIAGTYTPLVTSRLGGREGTIILSAVWACAVLGIAIKLVFPRRFELFTLVLYLAMGWSIVTVIRPLAAHMAGLSFRLLVAGGLIYSAGVVFYVWERLPFHRAIWHGFVLTAAILQFAAIAFELA